MPGIVGIINKGSREKNERDLRRMIDCMMHEPFSTSGTYINEHLGLYSGWVCHKDSFSDCMPILNENKDIVLLFSGENFTDEDSIQQLKRKRHEFVDFNASYLIHLYEEEGDAFLQQLNGWFSGLLVDLRKKKIVLFNDRYGMQRIYYYEGIGEFLFSSEAKSLLKVRNELRKFDIKSLGEFFVGDCVLQNRTLFSHISLMPGGSAWTLCNGVAQKDYYFKPDMWENQTILDGEIFYKKLRETFLNILPRYVRAKQPIAMSLTSGFDTRTIMSCLDVKPGELPCYTFTGMSRDIFDAKIARKVADICHQPHQVVRLDSKFLSNFPTYAERTIYITDGYHDIRGAYDIYFNELARSIAPIRMTGKFGSEILGNLSMLKKTSTFCEEFLNTEFKRHILEAEETFNDIKKGHKLSFAVFKETPWYQYGRLAMEMSKLTVRTPYMDNDLVKLMYQAPVDTRASKEIRLRLIEDGNPKLRQIMTDRGALGRSGVIFSKGAQLFFYILFKIEYMYLYPLPHWLTKIDSFLSSLHIERALVGRYQLGQYRLWFRNELSNYVKEILLDKRTAERPFWNKYFLEQIVNRHVRGSHNYSNEINKAMTVELIHRLFIDGK